MLTKYNLTPQVVSKLSTNGKNWQKKSSTQWCRIETYGEKEKRVPCALRAVWRQ